MTGTTPDRRRPEILAGVSLAGVTTFVVAVLALHVIQRRQSPVAVTISEYVLGAAGWLFPVACVGLGVASLALAALLRATRPVSSRIGLVLLTAWAVGMFLVAIFPTDPIDRHAKVVHLSPAGLVHAIAGQIAFVCFGVAAPLITRSLRRHGWAGPVMGAARISAVASVAGLAFALTVTALGLFSLFGLAERVMLPAYTAWLTLTILYARAHPQPRSPRPDNGAGHRHHPDQLDQANPTTAQPRVGSRPASSSGQQINLD